MSDNDRTRQEVVQALMGAWMSDDEEISEIAATYDEFDEEAANSTNYNENQQ